MDLKNNNQENQPAFKRQVHEYFKEKSLSADSKRKLTDLILGTPAALPSKPPFGFLRGRKASPLLSSMMSAAIAASITFILVQPSSEEILDPIAELTQLPGPKVYPPDFDLEGDPSAMNDIVYELFADKNFFASDLPAQVLAEYKPSEGRFFSWDGEPAVSIQMNQNSNAKTKKLSEPATLLIVKLSENSQRKFPKEKVTRKVAGKSGKMRKVKVWREGNFGYAMVQESVALNDTP